MNITKILKNCPKGMKLYSPIYGEVKFTEVTAFKSIGCEINGNTVYFHQDGSYYKGGECMLFPSKEQRDWNEFMIPFKDGDVIINTELNPGCKQYNIAIFRNYNISPVNKMTIHCQVNGANEFKTEMCICHKNWRLANTEEIERFITRMHESGYDFKDGKLITLPKFEVGDTITDGIHIIKIDTINGFFYIGHDIHKPDVEWSITRDIRDWKLAKFDTRTFKPYDKVLVKNGDGCWYPSLVSYVNSSGSVCIIDSAYIADYAIPFKGNEYLIGKFDDPDPYYITW